MQIRLYLDEDAMDGDVVEALRTRGVNVLTAEEAGPATKNGRREPGLCSG